MAGPKQLQNINVSNRKLNSTNVPLEVALLDGSGNQVTSFGGGTEYTEGDADATITGTALLFEIDSTANTVGPVSSTRPLPVTISGSAGSTQVSVKGVFSLDGTTSILDSTLNALRITSADVGGSTQVAVSSLAGAVIVRSTAAELKASVYQSTAADLNVTVAGYVAPSTTVQVSSVAGAVIVRSTQTSLLASVYQSTAADLNVTVAGYVAPSTTVQVSSVGGAVIVRSTQTSLLASVYQSTAADLNVTVAGYVAPSTTVQVSSLAGRVRAQNSTIGDFLAQVAQNSTVWAAQIDGRVRAQNSTIGDLLASVQQNSTVWQVQQGGYVAPSTTVQVSSLAGKVLVDQNSTVWPVQIPTSQSIQVKNSTIGDLLASVQQNSTVWQTQSKIQDSSGVSPNIVGTRPSTGAQGFAVRTVLNDLQSTCFSTLGNNSTSSTIVSSVAAVRHKVYAYSILSTNQVVNTLTFASSLANPIWQIALQSFAGGVSGANLAVTPPAWLFATEAASPLVFKVTGTTSSYHLSLSYFSEA